MSLCFRYIHSKLTQAANTHQQDTLPLRQIIDAKRRLFVGQVPLPNQLFI
jgi:hypothetical protein